jgi:hypothetical protein
LLLQYAPTLAFAPTEGLNIPPGEGELGREGQKLLDWLRTVTGKKTK